MKLCAKSNDKVIAINLALPVLFIDVPVDTIIWNQEGGKNFSRLSDCLFLKKRCPFTEAKSSLPRTK